MNEFLRKFSTKDKEISTNEALFQHLKTDSEASKRFSEMVVAARDYKNDLLFDQPELKTESQFEDFVKEHQFWTSDKAVLVMANANFKFIDYKSYDINETTSADMLADVLSTKYATELFLIHPVNTIDRDNFRKSIKQLDEFAKDLNKLAKENGRQGVLIQAITNRHQSADIKVFINLMRDHDDDIFLDEKDYDPQELIEEARTSGAMKLPVMPPFPYDKGFDEFCEYYAKESLKGKNFWKHNNQVKDLVKLSYEFLEDEKVGSLWLDKNAKILEMETLSKGTPDSVPFDYGMIEEQLNRPEVKQWVSFHNHPSGDPTPSSTDIYTNYDLEEQTKKLEKPLIEHFVIGANNVFEFSKNHNLVKGISENASISKDNYLDKNRGRDF
ncbi:hypothetical protein AAEX37_01067 [Oligella sp. MSHR50489EDL]|uniref:JAB domain-containing protein n=1 Tax=Oligella sp. MSHR50489EDL TaxID=3139409 RepID=UPI003D815709